MQSVGFGPIAYLAAQAVKEKGTLLNPMRAQGIFWRSVYFHHGCYQDSMVSSVQSAAPAGDVSLLLLEYCFPGIVPR